jgi:excisionase family DNA binding protein
MQYYTIKEASERLGIKIYTIKRLVRTGKIESKKGEKQRSPYQIPQTELEKIREIASPKEEKTTEKAEIKLDSAPERRYYEDFMEMQKILVETMRDLASTQEQIALTLAQLVKKV